MVRSRHIVRAADIAGDAGGDMSDWTEEYITLIDDCEKRDSKLSAWDADFLVSIRERLEAKRPLSQKQINVLDEIWEKATRNG
jgi:hypothetical protein